MPTDLRDRVSFELTPECGVPENRLGGWGWARRFQRRRWYPSRVEETWRDHKKSHILVADICLIFRCVHPSGGLVDYALEENGFMNHQQTFLWLSLLTLVNGCLFIVEFLNSCRWETSMVLYITYFENVWDVFRSFLFWMIVGSKVRFLPFTASQPHISNCVVKCYPIYDHLCLCPSSRS